MRFVPAFAAAAVISLALFWLMQFMIAGGSQQVTTAEDIKAVEFVRVKRESEPELKKRVRPEKPPIAKALLPPLPKIQVSALDRPEVSKLRLSAPRLDLPLNIDGTPYLGEIAPGGDRYGDHGIIPLVRVPPRYPRRARMGRVEGWVKLEFTVTEAGTVKDVKLLEAKPLRVFDQAAMRAVYGWRFKPKTIDGRPVASRAVQRLEFKLDK